MPIYSVTGKPLGINDPAVAKVVRRLGADVYRDLGTQPLCIVPIGSGGKLFGLGLYGYLAGQDINGKPLDVVYAELDEKTFQLDRPVDGNRTIVFVDDNFATGRTHRAVSERFPNAIFAATFDPFERAEYRYDHAGPVRHGIRGLTNRALKTLAYWLGRYEKPLSLGLRDQEPDLIINYRIEELGSVPTPESSHPMQGNGNDNNRKDHGRSLKKFMDETLKVKAVW